MLREINIRDCFRPESNDSVFLSADFNQMEMRIMAHLSNDHHLVHFFNAMQGSDIYVFMASLCFDCDESEVTKEQRACAKQLSLGILYGMGADNMAKRLTIFTGRTYTENEAGRLISKWKEKVSSTSSVDVTDCFTLSSSRASHCRCCCFSLLCSSLGWLGSC